MSFTSTSGVQRRGWLFIAAVAALGALLLAQGARQASAEDWTYNRLALSGAEEVPPVTSNTAGLFSGHFDAKAKTFQTDLSADGTTFVAAHLHLGAKGANGPVVALLYSSADGEGAIHPTVLVTPDSLTGPLKGDWAGFQKALAEGNIYANVHSKTNPGGVLRAQLPAKPELAPPPATKPAVAPKPPTTGTGLASGSTNTLPLAFGAVLMVTAIGGAAWKVSRKRA